MKTIKLLILPFLILFLFSCEKQENEEINLSKTNIENPLSYLATSSQWTLVEENSIIYGYTCDIYKNNISNDKVNCKWVISADEVSILIDRKTK